MDLAGALERDLVGWSRPPVGIALRNGGWTTGHAPDDRPAPCRRCGVSVGPGEADVTGCAACRRARGRPDAVIRLGSYVEPLRGWVAAIKYGGWEAMAFRLGHELGTRVRRDDGDGQPTIVVPVPMPAMRRLYRGIDHARCIARGVAAAGGWTCVSILGRNAGAAGPQTGQAAGRRRRAAVGVRLRPPERRLGLAGVRVILVDDVCTTNRTARSAVRVVRRLGPARVVLAVLAVTNPPSRRAAAGSPPRTDGVDREGGRILGKNIPPSG
jgi:predicted amidophosphoribosyltransferase